MAKGSITDELILLALFPANDGWPVGAGGTPRVPSFLRAAVSVALLADLAAGGVVEIGDRVSRTGRDVPQDADPHELAGRIAARPGETPEYWAIQTFLGEPERHRLSSLRRRGQLREQERTVRRLWWRWTVRRQFVCEDNPVTATAVQRLGDAVRTGAADEGTVALLAIVYACGLQRSYFRGQDRRIREFVGGHWAVRATRHCLATFTPAM